MRWLLVGRALLINGWGQGFWGKGEGILCGAVNKEGGGTLILDGLKNGGTEGL